MQLDLLYTYEACNAERTFFVLYYRINNQVHDVGASNQSVEAVCSVSVKP
jgi:hypothetical protein